MATPTRGAVHRLKRVCRFLKGHARPVQEFVMQEPASQLTVYTDSDWAGDEVEGRALRLSSCSTGGTCCALRRPRRRWWRLR